jgi:hypothetical protein
MWNSLKQMKEDFLGVQLSVQEPGAFIYNERPSIDWKTGILLPVKAVIVSPPPSQTDRLWTPPSCSHHRVSAAQLSCCCPKFSTYMIRQETQTVYSRLLLTHYSPVIIRRKINFPDHSTQHAQVTDVTEHRSKKYWTLHFHTMLRTHASISCLPF